ncbi:SGNH/GDSL hydrolase family protein [Mycobacterium shigaense]|uniref:Lysophospholipase n=1 Tax=Mycobacterium shigaense TaxID=722731 RepID=A0A1Z4EGG7_9MYCO|nr:lysophospholipase [Mycobacterium shigaense]
MSRTGIRFSISLGVVYGASQAGYRRYVALGDSQTEGLWDGDETTGLLGFADRLAVLLDSLYPGLQYANLAVRGKLLGDVLREQIPEALAMEPDLITVCAGMNDVIQPGRNFGRALAELDYLYATLAESGATVVTTTFPNVAQFLPFGWIVSKRLARINFAIRASAARYGFPLVDLYNAASMRDWDTWSYDRVHASPKGHILFAAAAAEALNLPDSNHDWAKPHPDPTQLSVAAGAYGKLRWTQDNFFPWVWRRMRGMSAADGRFAKRPQLEPVNAPPAPHRGAQTEDIAQGGHP